MNFNKDTSNITVMIVDDDKDDHFFLSKAIRDVIGEVKVQSFYNGCELLEHLQNNNTIKPNIIFLDLNMPKMDGRTTTTLLKKDDNLSSIPVIIFTTSNSLIDRLELTDLGADDFFTKPISAKDLQKIVENVVNRWL